MTESKTVTAQSPQQKSETEKQLLYCARLRRHLEEIGWFRSVEAQLPVDRDGNYLPWYTYSSIAFLNGRVRPHFLVFEYGSGASTLWWSKLVSRVVSVEHDRVWFNSFSDKMPSNVQYLYCELVYGGEYSRTVLDHNKEFNIIVIDGRDRVNCAKNSIGALTDDGVIIWDNSDRQKYEEGYSYLIQNGFRRIDFESHGPINNYKWCTSVFYRDRNCFGI